VGDRAGELLVKVCRSSSGVPDVDLPHPLYAVELELGFHGLNHRVGVTIGMLDHIPGSNKAPGLLLRKSGPGGVQPLSTVISWACDWGTCLGWEHH